MSASPIYRFPGDEVPPESATPPAPVAGYDVHTLGERIKILEENMKQLYDWANKAQAFMTKLRHS